MTPMTGVYSGNDIDWNWFDGEHIIDLDYESAALDMFAERGIDRDSEEAQEVYDEMESFDGTTYLYGDWEFDKKEKGYGPQETTEDNNLCGIYDSNMNIMQVVFSKHTRYGRLASPCYPNQVDARVDDPDEPDDLRPYEYYALPKDALFIPEKEG